jgi:ABC-type transport system, permease protein
MVPRAQEGDDVNLLLDALSWLFTLGNWGGASGIWSRLLQHLGFTLAVVAVASVLAIPAGIAIGHTRRGVAVVPMVTASARALPTLGLLTLVGLWSGLGLVAPFCALLVLAIPPMLAGAYSGITSAEPVTVDAARAIGLSSSQVLTQVELPAAVPLLLEGLRSTTLQVVATATLAAYTADVGLGRFLFTGLKTRDYAQMIGGALLVVVLALALDLLLLLVKRLITRKLDPRTETASAKET